MTLSKDQMGQELERRLRIVSDQLNTDKGLDFETLMRISDYVDFVENSPVLLSYIEADTVKWNEKRDEVNALKLGFLGQLRRRSHLKLQSDFYFSHSYWKLLHVYHSISYLKKGIAPTDFDWDFGFKRAISDIQDIQIGLVTEDTFFWFRLRNSLFFSKSQYQKWLERIHLALMAELVKPELKKGLSFDRDKSILMIGDKIVRITLKNDKTNAHYVLEHLFDHGITELADYTNILEEKFKGEFKGKERWRGVYRACQDIQHKVHEQAHIDNFLDTTTGKTGYVRINSTYA